VRIHRLSGKALAAVLGVSFAVVVSLVAALAYSQARSAGPQPPTALPHVGPAVSPPPAKTAGKSQPKVPSAGKFYLGVSSDPNTIATYDRVSGVERPSVLGGYVLNGGRLMSIVDHSSHLRGTIPLVSWGVDFTHDAVLSGSDNAYLSAQAKALAAYRKPVFVRLDWEMNGNWYPEWGSGAVSPTVYVESWRYIREYFWLEHAYNVAFVWCPNVGDPAGGAAYDWYPGDAYVDWVGLDAYPQSRLAGQGLLSGPDGLDSMARQAAAHKKPLMLAEWAPSTLSDDVAQPFDLIFQWALRFPGTVKALVYFNYGSSTTDHFLVDYPAGAAAYRKLIDEHRANIVGADIKPGG
jgi:hypothetical protein